MSTTVAVMDTGVLIDDLILTSQDVIQYFKQIEEKDRPQVAIRAIEIGVFCLQRTQFGHSLDFVRGEVEKLINSTNTAISRVPDQVQEKLGGDAGPLAPIHAEINAAKSVISEKAQDVKTLFEQHLDPAKTDTTLGKALSGINELLNSKSPDSVQQKLEATIASIAQKDGTLASAVKAVVGDAISPLKNAVENLRNALLQEKAAEEAVTEAKEKTPGKGGDFEDQLYPVLQRIAKPFGDVVEDVHNQHKAGDFLITLDKNTIPGKQIKLAIDAKSGPVNVPNCERVLDESKENWSAQGAMVIFAGADLVPNEQVNPFGSLANGVVCVFDKVSEDASFLAAAYRITRLEVIREVQRQMGVVEPAAVREKIEQAAAKLRELSTLKRRITDAKNAIGDLWQFVDRIQGEIFDLLDQARIALGSSEPLPAIPTEAPVES